MASILEGFVQAFSLIFRLDQELLGIILLSLEVSGTALLIGSLLGVPAGSILGLRNFKGRGILISLSNTFMGLPPVVVGLFVYLLLSRRGPLGFMALLYSPSAMITAQLILIFPIIVSLCQSAVISVDPIIQRAAVTLGATRFQSALTVVKEARYGILSGVIAGLGRAMGEVGTIIIVGGNIAGHTRVMTTTIALETDKGNFELALALGIILLFISLLINIGLHLIQKKGIMRTTR
jgi:tungstate transport system permease protein